MEYNILMACPAIPRMAWELDVVITNIRQFTNRKIILLFTEHDFTVPVHFRSYPNVDVHVYAEREDRSYIPSIQPWLWWHYLSEDPEREKQNYFYIDSDVIFREWPLLSDISADMVVGSNCSHYIDLEYIEKCQRGPEIAVKMAEICGITREQMVGIPGIGAHLLISNPTAKFWRRTYEDNNRLHHYLVAVDTNLQKWTISMWAQLWGWVRESKTLMVNDELAFCLPTDPIEKFDKVKILHNAGVLATMSHELFWKGQYDKTSPIGQKFDWVRKDRCSYQYAQAVEKVLL